MEAENARKKELAAQAQSKVATTAAVTEGTIAASGTVSTEEKSQPPPTPTGGTGFEVTRAPHNVESGIETAKIVQDVEPEASPQAPVQQLNEVSDILRSSVSVANTQSSPVLKTSYRTFQNRWSC